MQLLYQEHDHRPQLAAQPTWVAPISLRPFHPERGVKGHGIVEVPSEEPLGKIFLTQSGGTLRCSQSSTANSSALLSPCSKRCCRLLNSRPAANRASGCGGNNKRGARPLTITARADRHHLARLAFDRWRSTVAPPRLHQCRALGQQIGPPVRARGFITNRMCKRLLGDDVREVGLLSSPVAE